MTFFIVFICVCWYTAYHLNLLKKLTFQLCSVAGLIVKSIDNTVSDTGLYSVVYLPVIEEEASSD